MQGKGFCSQKKKSVCQNFKKEIFPSFNYLTSTYWHCELFEIYFKWRIHHLKRDSQTMIAKILSKAALKPTILSYSSPSPTNYNSIGVVVCCQSLNQLSLPRTPRGCQYPKIVKQFDLRCVILFIWHYDIYNVTLLQGTSLNNLPEIIDHIARAPWGRPVKQSNTMFVNLVCCS